MLPAADADLKPPFVLRSMVEKQLFLWAFWNAFKKRLVFFLNSDRLACAWSQFVSWKEISCFRCFQCIVERLRTSLFNSPVPSQSICGRSQGQVS